jgi:hypothetical protein
MTGGRVEMYWSAKVAAWIAVAIVVAAFALYFAIQ